MLGVFVMSTVIDARIHVVHHSMHQRSHNETVWSTCIVTIVWSTVA